MPEVTIDGKAIAGAKYDDAADRGFPKGAILEGANWVYLLTGPGKEDIYGKEEEGAKRYALISPFNGGNEYDVRHVKFVTNGDGMKKMQDITRYWLTSESVCSALS